MLYDRNDTQDPGHQPMSAVLPVPAHVVVETHHFRDYRFMLDTMLRVGPEDKVGHARIPCSLVANGPVLDAQFTKRGQAGAVRVPDAGQKSFSFGKRPSKGLVRRGSRRPPEVEHRLVDRHPNLPALGQPILQAEQEGQGLPLEIAVDRHEVSW